MVSRRGSSVVTRMGLVVVATVAFIGSSVSPASAQETETVADDPAVSDACIGTITASLAAESLPTGEWSAHGDCLMADDFYEYVEGPVLAKAAVAEVVYSDGHQGRVAAGVLTLGNGLGLGIVGVEDAATGLVKWSAVLDEFVTDGDAVSVDGQGVAVFPIEHATVSARLTGTGTDVKPFLDGYTDPAEEITATDEPDDVAAGDEESSSEPTAAGTDGSEESTTSDEGSSGDPSSTDDGVDDDRSGSTRAGDDDGESAGDDKGSASSGGSSTGDSSDAGDGGIDYGVIDRPRSETAR